MLPILPQLHVQLFLPFLDGFLEVGHQDIFHSSVSLRSFSSAFVNSSMTAKAFTKWIHSESRLTRKLNTTFFKYSKLISLCPQKPFTCNRDQSSMGITPNKKIGNMQSGRVLGFLYSLWTELGCLLPVRLLVNENICQGLNILKLHQFIIFA